MSYHLSEFLISHYPRLPMAVISAAMVSFIGPETLTHLVREWGVDPASSPGPEVDPGLLQFLRLPPGHPLPRPATSRKPTRWARGLSSRIVYDDEVAPPPTSLSAFASSLAPDHPGTTLALASTSFVRALFGALYLHAGRSEAKQFFRAHILSRHLNLSALFEFRDATRDLSRLCAREGFEAPVARIISETGRRSHRPVFVVGVFSGRDKLGEASGASLDEARTRAAVAALKGWYLYSPLGSNVPSDAEDGGREAEDWKPVMVDGGEVVV
jgi:dsRNA-specific ribonuclease